jgi:hypothetical protein
MSETVVSVLIIVGAAPATWLFCILWNKVRRWLT